MESKSESREVIDTSRVLDVYNNQLMGREFPQLKALEDALVETGISPEKQQSDFLVPLIVHWCELADPQQFPESARSVLIDFATAVIDGEVVSRSIDAFSSLVLSAGEVELQDGIKIRTINDEELRKFGRETLRSAWNPDPTVIPSDRWAVLEIEISHAIGYVPNEVATLRNAILTALILSGAGSFRFIPLGVTKSYGMFATAREILGERNPQDFGHPPWEESIVDIETVGKIKEVWPRLIQIIESDSHYLRIPAQRLVEGARRRRLVDAVIDFAIGLEALLLRRLRNELSYRFALRGATIMTWQGGEKRQAFDDLRDFYELRSKIVHGEAVTNPALHLAKVNGERMLREIWWWYFEEGESPDDNIRKIDDRISG